MYAVHSNAASAITAHVAAASAANQQLNSSRPGAGSTQGQPGSSSSGRVQEKPHAHKEDFVDVEKSNMVMLVSVVWVVTEM
jgi:hypothetical protein